jgi:glutamyl endopeptidase
MNHLPPSSPEDMSELDGPDAEDFQLPPTNPLPPSLFKRFWGLFSKPKDGDEAHEAAESNSGSEQVSVRSVQGNDDREVVQDTSSAPYQSIAYLELWGKSKASGRGTAWLVGPRILLTAAHNLYSPYFSNQEDPKEKDRFAWARKVEITPGRSRGIHPFGNRLAKTLVVPKAYVEGGKKAIGGEHDYGAILIGKAFNKTSDLLMVTVNNPKGLVEESMPMTICGYPLHLHSDKSKEVTEPTQYQAVGSVQQVSPSGRLAYYQIDTSPGQSGAPLILKIDNKFKAVGIHTFGIPKNENRGTLITGPVFSQIEHWIKLSYSQTESAGDDTVVKQLT